MDLVEVLTRDRHADNEPGLGPEPVIASLLLGAVRRFQLKHRTDRTGRVTDALAKIATGSR
jgi:hypothetical protein